METGMKIATTEQLRPTEPIAQPQEFRDLFSFLAPFLTVHWKKWPTKMIVSSFSGPDEGRFVLSGECPHCNRSSVFMPVTSSHQYLAPSEARWTAVLRCAGCHNFILGIV